MITSEDHAELLREVDARVLSAMPLTCEKETGTWTVRLRGVFIFHSVEEAPAQQLAANLRKAFAN